MNHLIPLSTAVAMTTLFRSARLPSSGAASAGLELLPLCETFDREAFDLLLGQEGCTSLRVYYGMSPDNLVHAVIVGVNQSNEDMVDSIALPDSTSSDPIVELGQRCPPFCPPTSPLNK